MFTLKANNDANIELRNIQEQVQKNKEDIAKHYEIDRALANFGIKIVGTVATPQELPDPLTYSGEYGDGYAVGEPGSYVYYIYTRPDPNAGRPDNHWLDVGSISVVGPQGPQGPQGERGERGLRGPYIFRATTPPTSGVLNGDLFLPSRRSTQYTYGTLYVYNESAKQWTVYGSIIGPQGIQGLQGLTGAQGEQGPQGPKGERGDVGGLVNIVGKLDNTSQLPTPESIDNPTVAYLVGANNELYIQIGETPATSVWQNMGQLNVGTYVTVGGEYQNIWDADTKVSVNVPRQTGAFIDAVYARRSDGTVVRQAIAQQPVARLIPCYNDTKTLRTDTPIEAKDCINKEYLERELEFVSATISGLQQQLNQIRSYNFATISFFNYVDNITIQYAVTIPYTGDGLPTDQAQMIQSLASTGNVQPVAVYFERMTPDGSTILRNSFEGNSKINYNANAQTGTATITYYDNSGDIATITINLNDVINYNTYWSVSISPITPISN